MMKQMPKSPNRQVKFMEVLFMKKRTLSMLTLLAMLVSIIGIAVPVSAAPTAAPTPNQITLANYIATGNVSGTTGTNDNNGGIYAESNALKANGQAGVYGFGTQGSGAGTSYHWGNNGQINKGGSYGTVNVWGTTTTATRNLLTQTFADDTTTVPATGLVLDDPSGIYLYESEFLPIVRGSANNFTYKFTGNDGKEIISLYLDRSNAVLRKGGTNISGASKSFPISTVGSTGAGGFVLAATATMPVGYLKVEFDFNNSTLSAWIVQRKTSSGSYSETQPTSSHLLIKDYNFGSDITELASTTIAGTVNSTQQYGFGFTFIKISQIPAQDIVDAAAAAFSHPDFTDVIDDIALPASFNGTDVSWISSEPGYMADDGTVIQLPQGSDLPLTMTPVFTRGTASATGTPVNVLLLDGSKVPATVTPETASFDKNIKSVGYLDVDITFDPGDWAFSALKNGAVTLVEDQDYTVSNNVYTIKKEYLKTLAAGTAALTFEATGGVSPVCTITINDSSTPAQFYSGLTAVEDKEAKTITLSGTDVNDVIDVRDVRDNYFYKLSTSASDYLKINSRSQASNMAINSNSFCNAFDGFTNTAGVLNLVYTSSRHTPSIIAFDLGEEKNWNELFIQFNTDTNAQKITQWEIYESNNSADFDAANNSNGALASNYAPSGSWGLLYASKAGESLGGETIKTNAKLELGAVSKSRYILMNIKAVSQTSSTTFNQSWCIAANYLRDVKSDEYKIDYSNQIIEVDDLASGIAVGDFLGNIIDNTSNLTVGVFADAIGTTSVTGNIADGNYLVTYYDNAGVKDIVRAYKIRPVLPRVTGAGLKTLSGSDVGGTVSISYDYLFDGDDDSIITWYSGETAIKTGTDKTYTIEVSDVGEMITAVITPKSGNLEGVSFTSQERGSGYSPIIGGNILEGLDSAKMTTTILKGSESVAVSNWTPANLKKMLDGNGQFAVGTSDSSNPAGKLIFTVKLNNARYLNTVNMAFYGEAFKTVKIEGKLNGGYGKDQDGNNVTAPLFNIPSKNTSAGGAIDPTIETCAPTLVDEIIFTADMSNIRYTNGLLYFEAFCDVTDEVAVQLDGKALELLGGFEKINSKVDIPEASEGIMYSNIEYDFSSVIGTLIDANGDIIFDGISAAGTIDIVCSRGEEHVSKTVPFSIFNTNLYEFSDFALNADSVEIEDAADLTLLDKTETITLTGNILRTVPGTFPLSVIVVGYDENGKLENIKVSDVTSTNSSYSLDCGQFLLGKNISELKVFAWDMPSQLPFAVNGITAKKKID